MKQPVAAVTGSFGYTGRHITERLLARGQQVITLTGHPDRPNPFGARVKAFPFNFDAPGDLQATLQGVDVLYNTYWVRFNRGETTFERAVNNSRRLFQAAEAAGVRRAVHISITHADPASPLPYFRGKGLLEEALRASSLSYAILRPTVIFGPGDILINNIAWFLRRFPIFTVPGSGQYRLQPIYVGDLAELAAQAGAGDENQVIDATGPETYTFDALVRLLAGAVGSRARILHLPPGLAFATVRFMGLLLGDVLLTRDEIQGLMAGLLASDAPPAGTTRLESWLAENAARLGREYASELKRHYRTPGGPG